MAFLAPIGHIYERSDCNLQSLLSWWSKSNLNRILYIAKIIVVNMAKSLKTHTHTKKIKTD